MNEMILGLYAALRLARGRQDGVLLLTLPPDAAHILAVRSFWALGIALPAFVALRLVDLLNGGFTVQFAHSFAQDTLSYLIGWVGFALVSHRLAALSGRAVLWPRFIAAWNFCNVLQYAMLLLATVPDFLGAPGWLAQTCWVVAIGWALWLEFFVTKVAMGFPTRVAVAWVLLDFGIGLAIDSAMSSFG